MIRYAITDGTAAGDARRTLARIAAWLADRIEMIQIREKQLTARELLALARAACALPNPSGTKILVNERADVALCVGAAGVHLPATSIGADLLRAKWPDLTIGVSCHSIGDVRRAAEATVTIIEDPDPVVRGLAIYGAAQRPSLLRTNLDKLKPMLTNQSVFVRSNTAVALGRIGVAATNALICRARGRADVFVPAKLAELYHADWVARASGLPKIAGWRPLFDLKDGFSNTFQWYRDHSFIT